VAGSNTTHLIPVFGRLFWMMIGPLALAMTTYFIVSSGNGWTTTADFLFFVILGGMILGKWLEFRGGDPQTQAGEPATAADLRRYILMVVITGPAVWTVANILGNYFVRP
jgi:hypothetical protein